MYKVYIMGNDGKEYYHVVFYEFEAKIYAELTGGYYRKVD